MSQALLDDDEDDLPPTRQPARDDGLPPGVANNGDDQIEYEAVDVDENHQPLTGPHAAPEDTIRGEDQEADEAGQSRIARRRANQRRRAQESEAANAVLQAEVERLRAEAEESRAFRERISPRIDQIDQGRFEEQLSTVDREMQANAARSEHAIEAMAEAMASGDAQAHAKALREHSVALVRGVELNQQKQALEATRTRDQAQQPAARQQQPPAQPRVAAPPQTDPEQVRLTQAFLQRNPWFRPSDPNDIDSNVARTIDRQVVQAGFRPNEAEYWEEIEARCRERMPHLYQRRQPSSNGRAQQPQVQRRGPMVSGGASSGSGAAGDARKVLMTPDRKAALIQIGALDPDGRTIANKEKYQRVMHQFHKFDAEHGTGQRS